MNSVIREDLKNIYLKNNFWENLFTKTILITGAYGMLASYVTYMLIYLNEYHSANIKIIAIGRNEEKAKKRFKKYFFREYFNFIQSDLKDISNLYLKPDFVIHAASNASSQFYGIDPVGTMIPNFLGTYNLLELARKNSIQSMLFISSGEVYGNTNKDYIKEDDFGISNPLDIRYCYGESKRMGECLCKSYNYQFNIPVKIVRLGHTYGPTMDVKNDKRVFSEFVGNVVENKNIIIKSDGTPMRAFCYIADAVDGFFKILFRGSNGEAYNLANKDGLISIRDLGELLANIYKDRGVKIVFKKRSEDEHYIESKIAKHNIPDSEKLEKLGWKIEYSIEEGFKRTVKGVEEINESF